MAQENVDAVKAIYDGFFRRDLDAIVAQYDPDCRIEAPEGPLEGHAGARAFWEPRVRGELSADVGEPKDLGAGRVVVRVRLTSTTPQGPMTVTSWNLWTLDDDHRAVRWQFFTSRDQALEAAGNAI